MESRSRRKETSCGARPGCVGDEERICEIWIGRPVRVERTRRWVRDLWVVKRRYSGGGAAIFVFCVLCFVEGLLEWKGSDFEVLESLSQNINLTAESLDRVTVRFSF
jgi:hypothetical protein